VDCYFPGNIPSENGSCCYHCQAGKKNGFAFLLHINSPAFCISITPHAITWQQKRPYKNQTLQTIQETIQTGRRPRTARPTRPYSQEKAKTRRLLPPDRPLEG